MEYRIKKKIPPFPFSYYYLNTYKAYRYLFKIQKYKYFPLYISIRVQMLIMFENCINQASNSTYKQNKSNTLATNLLLFQKIKFHEPLQG